MTELSDTEKAVQEAFRTGAYLDVGALDDPVVRAPVVRFLLLGGLPAEGGDLPALRLTGAHLTGAWAMAYAEGVAPVSLRDCRFDERPDFYAARLRQFSLRGCTLPGALLSNATFAGSLRISGCVVTGTISLAGAHVGNALLLEDTRINPAVGDRALDGTRLRVGSDLLVQRLHSAGEVRLNNAEIVGSLRWTDVTIDHPDGPALFAADLRVGAVAEFRGGVVDGSVGLHSAQITSHLRLDGITLLGKVGLRHVVTRELTLRPAAPPAGPVDLRHSRVGLLRDDPASWPGSLRVDGLTYEALESPAGPTDRLRWLRLDPNGYHPQAYNQLAAVYRNAGREDDARTVLMSSERHRREGQALSGRIWGWLQDVTVGYGYRPGRALAWLAVLLLIGTVVFQAHPPRAAEPGKAPVFVALAYTADLILPVVDLGQQSAYQATGATIWLAYLLIFAGLVFATTIAAAAARRLRRT